MPSTKTRIPALATTNRATVPASCQLAEHPTEDSDGDDEIGYTVNPSQSSKPISRDDGAISFEPIRALSTLTTKTHHNIQQRLGQHIPARTTTHKTTESPPEQPNRNFRTTNHATTEPSSDQPIKMYRTHWPTPSRENHQILQDLSPRDNASRT